MPAHMIGVLQLGLASVLRVLSQAGTGAGPTSFSKSAQTSRIGQFWCTVIPVNIKLIRSFNTSTCWVCCLLVWVGHWQPKGQRSFQSLLVAPASPGRKVKWELWGRALPSSLAVAMLMMVAGWGSFPRHAACPCSESSPLGRAALPLRAAFGCWCPLHLSWPSCLLPSNAINIGSAFSNAKK